VHQYTETRELSLQHSSLALSPQAACILDVKSDLCVHALPSTKAYFNGH